MDLRKIIAAWPLLRRLWRFLPGPLRIPLLVIAAVGWLWQRLRGQDGPSDTSPEAA